CRQWSSAIRATEIRGSSVRSTRRLLNAASCVRRVPNFEDREPLLCTRFMVCTIIDSAHHYGGHRVRACLLTRSTGRRPPDDAYTTTHLVPSTKNFGLGSSNSALSLISAFRRFLQGKSASLSGSRMS